MQEQRCNQMYPINPLMAGHLWGSADFLIGVYCNTKVEGKVKRGRKKSTQWRMRFLFRFHGPISFFPGILTVRLNLPMFLIQPSSSVCLAYSERAKVTIDAISKAIKPLANQTFSTYRLSFRLKPFTPKTSFRLPGLLIICINHIT